MKIFARSMPNQRVTLQGAIAKQMLAKRLITHEGVIAMGMLVRSVLTQRVLAQEESALTRLLSPKERCIQEIAHNFAMNKDCKLSIACGEDSISIEHKGNWFV